MKVTALLGAGMIAAALFGASRPNLSQDHCVYLLPMQHGLDQYLANRLTNLGVMNVVTDPQKADVIMTDSIGANFEARMGELYPAPKPEPAEAAPKEKEGTEKEEAEAAPAPAVQDRKPVQFTTFSRGKGNVFLVDAKTRAVLWSIYDRPANSSSEELDKTAARIARELQRASKAK